MLWDLFCRVVDNYGDVGVCWRLARDLAARGERVRLRIDDASALAWMAPGGAPGVEVLAFDDPAPPGNVVVEAFGCDPPAAFVAAMVAMHRAPVWINLEYLSAEAWVERSHGLPSPQPNGLVKWFFFPGFSESTGGLLREPGLMAERQDFDRTAWLGAKGIARRPGERLVSLFCYEARPQLLQALAGQPTLLLLTPGAAQALAAAEAPGLRTHSLDWLDQRDYDRLLWSCDVNFVRGEDSLVRAIWAGAPFVWQIYPQHDGVHALKLQALIERMPALPRLAALWRAWNGLEPAWPLWPDPATWAGAAAEFSARMAARDDLASRLRSFAAAKLMPGC
ncbi:MAG: elongation factor P maturation arginine rhamnosyltransferase EarP [Burkholderiales bacterium]|nr:elongation factor P maturation arginine rhamnosyltransferase EarP [Burkholderiales bacterium]